MPSSSATPAPPELPPPSADAVRMAALRERFSFESTQLLVGAQSPAEAISRVIQLVCQTLGWEWGAYWETEAGNEAALVCRHAWCDHADLQPFATGSQASRTRSDDGILGRVWRQHRSEWTEDVAQDLPPERATLALAAGLKSGYAFPVQYRTAEGVTRSPGVLEFLSLQSRQREAQLPAISAAIAGLIAQTVQRLEQEARIRHLAQRDGLTGLYNRTHFHHLLYQACHPAQGEATPFALLVIDLDRFKPVNDAFGHDAGNAVLATFAQRLNSLIPSGGTCCRLGGDEFAVMLPGVSPQRLQDFAQNVLIAARTPVPFEGKELRVSASLGVSQFPDDGREAADLLRQADTAMYRSKHEGRDTLSFYTDVNLPALEERQAALLHEMHLATELREALVNQNFFLAYQPIFDTASGQVMRLEALLRWRRPDGTIALPRDFLPAAEHASLLPALGRWVMRQACVDLAWLRRHGYPRLRMHVNLSTAELVSPSLAMDLAAITKATGVSPRLLGLELGEGALPLDPGAATTVLLALRQLGFQIYLSDVGTGHSPLARLKTLPITGFKLDHDVMAGLPRDPGDRALVRTLLDLGHHLKLTVIAQRVETDAQLGFLRQFGCPLVQGWVLGRPADLSHYLEYPLPRPQ